MSHLSPPPDRPRTPRARRVWLGVAGSIPILGLLVAVPGGLNDSLQLKDRLFAGSRSTGGDGASRPPDPGTVTPATPSSSQEHCFVGARAVANCGVAHDREDLHLNTCTLGSVIQHMGGDPQVETLTDSLKVRGSGSTCTVSGIPAGIGVSLRGILNTPSGLALRVCWVDHHRTPCSTPHEGELIYQGATRPDCRERFEEYAGVSYATFEDQIALEPGRNTTPFRCWAMVRGHQHLSLSLRKNGHNDLPLQ